jgi:hypothetical protein
LNDHNLAPDSKGGNEKPTGTAIVEKSNYIPYAYTFQSNAATVGQLGKTDFKQPGVGGASDESSEQAGNARIRTHHFGAVLSRKR